MTGDGLLGRWVTMPDGRILREVDNMTRFPVYNTDGKKLGSMELEKDGDGVKEVFLCGKPCFGP